MVQTPEPHTYSLPAAAPYTNHGRTPAAWLLMLGASLGVLVVGLGLVINANWLIIVGVVIAVAALVVSLVLRSMGMGQPGPTGDAAADEKNKDWYNA